MSDDPKPPADETPMQRALRLKKSALDARQTPGGGTPKPRQSAAAPSGASKPWMKK